MKVLANRSRAGYSPPCIKARRGGCVIKKYCEATEADAAGVVFLVVLIRKTTPASLSADASLHFIDCSATPPCFDARREIMLHCNSLTPSYTVPTVQSSRLPNKLEFG